MSIFDNIKGKVQKEMAQREQMKDYVRNHVGTQAICAYMTNLFDKGGSAYYWLKENKVPLFTKVQENRVLLCYTQYYKDAMPKDIDIAKISFQEMFDWYGLKNGEGYRILDNKLQMSTLDGCISSAVQNLAHIKYNGGFLVRMFC